MHGDFRLGKKNPEFPCCKYLLFDTGSVQILPLRRCKCISRPLSSCQEIKEIGLRGAPRKKDLHESRKPPRSPHSLSSRFSTHLAGLFRFWVLQRQQITNNHILTHSNTQSELASPRKATVADLTLRWKLSLVVWER